MIKSREISIQEYSSEYRERVIEFLKDQKMTKEKFSWRYENSPYSIRPLVFIAVYNGNVIGVKGLVLQIFKIKNHRINVFSPCDAYVNEDFRRIGIMSRLNDFMIKQIRNEFGEKSIILNLSSNEYSTKGNLEQGWVAMNALKEYLHRISVSGFISFLLNKLFCGRFTSYNHKKDLKDNEVLFASKYRESILSEISNFHLSTIGERLSNICDNQFYLWRYGYDKDKFVFVTKYMNTHLMSYMILQKASSLKYFVAEFHSNEDQDLRQMISFVSKKFGISYMTLLALTLNDIELDISRRAGFYKERAWVLKLIKKKRLPALLRLPMEDTNDERYNFHNRNVRDLASWKIQFADVH